MGTISARFLGRCDVQGGKSQVLPPTYRTHVPLPKLLLLRAASVQLPPSQRADALLSFPTLSRAFRASARARLSVGVFCRPSVRGAQHPHRGSKYSIMVLTALGISSVALCFVCR